MSQPAKNRWLGVGGSALATLGAVSVLVLALADPTGGATALDMAIRWLTVGLASTLLAFGVAWAVRATRDERQSRAFRLRAPHTRIRGLNPTSVGVKPSAHPDLARAYLHRSIDKELDRAIRAGLGSTGPWLVEITGRCAVGKTRTLFEALRRYDSTKTPLHLVAPVDAEAVRALFDRASGAMKVRTPAALWLDNIEAFIADGLSVEDLYRWRAGGPKRLVVATSGSMPLPASRDVLTSLAASSRRIELDPTTTSEMQPLKARLPSGRFRTACTHGWAAYLVAAPLLAEKLLLQRHPGETEECPEGAALVRAVMDWARCGRTDAIGDGHLRGLWGRYVTPGRPCTDARFDVGLDWALRPVCAEIALLECVDSGYMLNPSVTQIAAEEGSVPQLEEVWAVAMAADPPTQQFYVSAKALSHGRANDATIGLSRVISAPADRVSPIIAALAADMLGHMLMGLEQYKRAIVVYQVNIDRFMDHADRGLRELGAISWLAKAVALDECSGPSQVEQHREAMRLLQRLAEKYFENHDSALRAAALEAAFLGIERELGSAEEVARDQVGRTEALRVWDAIIHDYMSDPGVFPLNEPNQF